MDNDIGLLNSIPSEAMPRELIDFSSGCSSGFLTETNQALAMTLLPWHMIQTRTFVFLFWHGDWKMLNFPFFVFVEYRQSP